MDEQQRVARAAEARAAQKLTLGEAADLLEHEGRTGRDLQDGFEIANTVNIEAGIPAEMEQIDPGWEGFVERQINEAAAPWEVAADAQGDAVLAKAVLAYETSDETELLVATMALVSTAPDRYEELLRTVAQYEPDFAAALAQTVTNTLGEWGAYAGEQEFQKQMAASGQANVADAQGALEGLAEVRQMTPEDVERAADSYRSVTGRPLRTALTGMLPEQRATFLQEVAVAAEVDEKAERMRLFAASFFGPSTDINSGLTINDRPVGGELPPRVVDPAYNAWKVEQSIRKQDAERVVAPKPANHSADEIKRGLIDTPDSRDWRSGLADAATGRRTSFDQ